MASDTITARSPAASARQACSGCESSSRKAVLRSSPLWPCASRRISPAAMTTRRRRRSAAGSAPVVAGQRGGQLGDQRVEQAVFGGVGVEQDEDAVAVVGVLAAPGVDAGVGEAVVEQVVEGGAQAGADRVAALQAAEAFDVGCEDGAMHWLDRHQATNYLNRAGTLLSFQYLVPAARYFNV